MLEIRHKDTGTILARKEASVWDGANLSGADLSGADLATANRLLPRLLWGIGMLIFFAPLAPLGLGILVKGRAGDESRWGRARRSLGRVLGFATLPFVVLLSVLVCVITLPLIVVRYLLERCGFRDRTELRRVELVNTKLCGADLRGATLVSVDLRGVDLRGADLSTPRLFGKSIIPTALATCDARDCQLAGANLSGAVLNSVRLSQSNLRDTIWTEALLSQVDLTGCDLSGADFERVTLFDVKMDATTMYDRYTRWPSHFDPQAHGATLIS